jgi:hypothetical protein
LQEYEIEVFNTNVGTTPILVALGLPIIRFGYLNLPPQTKLPTFTSKVVSTSTPFLYGLKTSDFVTLNTTFVFGVVRQEQPVARVAMDHSMDNF